MHTDTLSEALDNFFLKEGTEEKDFKQLCLQF